MGRYSIVFFNGWLMGRRFQRFAPCSFCEQYSQEDGVEDSIEHMTVRETVRNALGRQFDLSPRHWFLLQGDYKFKRGMSYVLFSLYTWVNTRRHSPWLRFTGRGLWRLAFHAAHNDGFKGMEDFKWRGTG